MDLRLIFLVLLLFVVRSECSARESLTRPGRWLSLLTQKRLSLSLCFISVSNLGAGGTQDIVMSNIANSILYATFAFGGLGAGAVTNLLGPRYTLLLGSLGYAFYIGSLWCFQTQGTKWFVYLGGAVLGACASLLWSARKF
jgi:hypothetical protein